MPELHLTMDSDDEAMDVDATGDPDAVDSSGIPELNDDTVVDEDTMEMETASRKRDEPPSDGGGNVESGGVAKRKRVGRVTHPGG